MKHQRPTVTLVIALCLGLAVGCSQSPSQPPSPAVQSQTSPILATERNIPTAQRPISTFTPSVPQASPRSEPRSPIPEEIDHPSPTPFISEPLNRRYRLVNWTADKADTLIRELRTIPDEIGGPDRGYHDFGYYRSFRFAMIVELEALRRFPNSPEANEWEWDSIYHMAQMGTPGVSAAYASLLESGLREHEAGPDGLGDWLQSHDERLTLSATQAPDLTGSLLTLTDVGTGSGAFYWMAEHKGSMRVFPLSAPPAARYGDFQFSSAEAVFSSFQDITGDQRPDILTSHVWQPGSPDLLVTNFAAFDVSSLPPKAIVFEPEPSNDGVLVTDTTTSASIEMRFDELFNHFDCPFTFYDLYRWDGQAFLLKERHYPDVATILETTSTSCADQLLFRLVRQLQAGDTRNVEDIFGLLEGWPYSPEPWWPYDGGSSNNRDRAYFLVGLYLALSNEPVLAQRSFSHIVEYPEDPHSFWSERASQFLLAYGNEADIAAACAISDSCQSLLSPKEMLFVAAQDKHKNPLAFLVALHVPVLATGQFDVDGDGRPDLWLSIDDGQGGALLYAFSDRTGGWFPIEIAVLASDGIVSLGDRPNFSGYRVIEVRTSGSIQDRLILVDEVTGRTSAADLCAEIEDRVHAIGETIWLSETNHRETIDQLVEYQSLYGARCSSHEESYMGPSAELEYLLATLTEEEGNSEKAAKIFLDLWQNHPNSPFALIAKARLTVDP